MLIPPDGFLIDVVDYNQYAIACNDESKSTEPNGAMHLSIVSSLDCAAKVSASWIMF